MKQVMSPTLVCYSAFKWAFLEALSLAKDVADAAVPHDDIKFVMNLYRTTTLTLGVLRSEGQRQPNPSRGRRHYPSIDATKKS